MRRFSFNVAKGRCEHCEGEGFVMVELLFLPSVYAPCPTCSGTRYNAATLQVTWQDRNIAEVLGMTVEDAGIGRDAGVELSIGGSSHQLLALPSVPAMPASRRRRWGPRCRSGRARWT